METTLSSTQQETQALRLKKLIQANQVLAQVDSIEDLLPRLLHLAQEVTNAEAASILLYKPETETLEFTLAINDFQDAASQILSQKIELKMGEGIAGFVAQTRESLLVEDAYKDKRFFGKADKASGFVTRSLLCAPVLNRDDLLGVVQVLNSKNKPFFDVEDLEILESFAHLAGVALVRSKLLVALLSQERLQVQLDAAARIQSNFLPKLPDLRPHAGIWAATKPAIYVGGDFYDCIPMPDESIITCIADVSGKGLPAALIGSAIWTRVRGLTGIAESPGHLLELLNCQLYDLLAQELFATMIIARFWPRTGKTQVALAGHYPPLILAHGGARTIDTLKGLPLGIDPTARYEHIDFSLLPNESLLFITDGVTEARNAKRVFFGEDNLFSFLKSHSELPHAQELMEHVETWRNGAEANDDVTVMEIWKL